MQIVSLSSTHLSVLNTFAKFEYTHLSISILISDLYELFCNSQILYSLHWSAICSKTYQHI